MGAPDFESPQPSAAEEFEAIVRDVVAGEGVSSEMATLRKEAVAELFGVHPDELSAAIAPVREVFEAKKNPSRDDIQQLAKANEMLGKLILINESHKILEGYQRFDDGTIQLTFPLGSTVQSIGELLNAAAKAKGIDSVFDENCSTFWEYYGLPNYPQVEPGKTYRFKFETSADYMSPGQQEQAFGKGAPLGVVVIAEACELLSTEHQETLFRDAQGTELASVHGADRGWVMVDVGHGRRTIVRDSNRDSAFAALVELE